MATDAIGTYLPRFVATRIVTEGARVAAESGWRWE
jgi:hypothetical protein